MTEAAAQQLADERNARDSPGVTWVPRETSPGNWEVVQARVPRPQPPDEESLARSRPAPPRGVTKLPPTPYEPPSRLSRAVGRRVGRGLEMFGASIAVVLGACPVLALVWVAVRLVGVDASEFVRRVATIVSAASAIVGVFAVRGVRAELRSIRNVTKPPMWTWRQFEFVEHMWLRLGQAAVALGVLGIVVAIPERLY